MDGIPSIPAAWRMNALALSDPDRTKLAALLGMMGSDHDGEALNAARLAARMVQRLKLTWPEVLEPKREVMVIRPQPAPVEWRARVETLLDTYSECLSDWESDFCDSIQQRRFLSEKQRAVLDRIWLKITGEAAR